MINRKIAAELYLRILVPWEAEYKQLPITGYFDIRSKAFTAYRRQKDFILEIHATKADSDSAVKANIIFGKEAKQFVVFQKGSGSRARSLLKHLRNSVAHAHLERVKIKNIWFIIFTSYSEDSTGKSKSILLRAQIKESELSFFISALQSTVAVKII